MIVSEIDQRTDKILGQKKFTLEAARQLHTVVRRIVELKERVEIMAQRGLMGLGSDAIEKMDSGEYWRRVLEAEVPHDEARAFDALLEQLRIAIAQAVLPE